VDEEKRENINQGLFCDLKSSASVYVKQSVSNGWISFYDKIEVNDVNLKNHVKLKIYVNLFKVEIGGNVARNKFYSFPYKRKLMWWRF